MLTVQDSCAECMPLAPSVLRPGNVSLVAVHRLSLSERADGNPTPIPDDQLIGTEVVKRFTDPVHGRLLGTDRREPYHILIRTDAVAEQMLPLIIQGQHVASYNWCSWSIALVGRYHETELPDRMWAALIETLAVLDVLPNKIRSHSEIDANKQPPCPGRFVNMDWLRDEVQKKKPPGCGGWDIRRRLRYIARAGFVL